MPQSTTLCPDLVTELSPRKGDFWVGGAALQARGVYMLFAICSDPPGMRERVSVFSFFMESEIFFISHGFWCYTFSSSMNALYPPRYCGLYLTW